MLAYILAIAVALTSLSLYLSAFFLPELHRKDDFLWSGVGLFYALVLWICAGRMTGGVLLGQAAAVSLVLSFGWQTVRLRRAIAHPNEQTDVSGFSLLIWLQNRLGRKTQPQPVPVVETTTPVTPETPQTVEEEPIVEAEPSVPETTPELELPPPPPIEAMTEEPVMVEADTEEETIEESVTIEPEVKEEPPTPIKPEPVKKKRGFSLKSLFGFGKPKPQPPLQSIKESLTKAEAEIEEIEGDEDWETPEAQLLEDVEEKVVRTVEEIEVADDQIVEKTSEGIIPAVEGVVKKITVEEKITITVESPSSSDEEVDQDMIEKDEFELLIPDDEVETVIENNQPEFEPSADLEKPPEDSSSFPDSSVEEEKKKDSTEESQSS